MSASTTTATIEGVWTVTVSILRRDTLLTVCKTKEDALVFTKANPLAVHNCSGSRWTFECAEYYIKFMPFSKGNINGRGEAVYNPDAEAAKMKWTLKQQS